MAMTLVSFTDNISDGIVFTGLTKLKIDNLQEGQEVILLEETTLGAFEFPGEDYAVMQYPTKSRLLELLGTYKIKRSASNILVGYET